MLSEESEAKKQREIIEDTLKNIVDRKATEKKIKKDAKDNKDNNEAN